MAFLMHFNRLHSHKDGRFISGDGDGDGIVNDHKNQKSSDDEKSSTSGGGAITLDEDDEEEDNEEKQAAEERKIRAENLKELARREKMKNNKKKSSKKKSSKSSSKKKKQKTVANKIAAVQETASKTVDTLLSIEDIKEKYPDLDMNQLFTRYSTTNSETISEVEKILSATHSVTAKSY